MKKITKITAAVISLAAFAFAGCNKKAETKEAQTIKFGVSPGTIRTAVVLLADHLGFYKDEGVNVELKEVGDATSALTSISLAKGELDIWGTGIVPDLNFIANGSDLVIFEGTAAEGGAIVAKPENVEKFKNITKENYEGITIATVRADTAWVVSRAYLIKQGVDVDKIKVMEVDSQANVSEAVNKGEAALGFTPAEFATRFKDKVSIVYEVGELEPLYVCCRQVTARPTLESKHDELVKFTKANLKALKYYNDPANRDEIVSYLAEYSSQTKDYVYNYLFQNRTIMTLNPNVKGVVEYYNSLVDAGYFKGNIKIEDHVTSSIYDEALAEIKKENPDDKFYETL